MRPTLRQLEYLVALAEHCHFGRAAEACHVSQPALSTQIKELERILGTVLFERDRRRVLPTQAGLATVGRARTVLDSVDELIAVGRGTGRPLEGPLALGIIPTVAPYVLPRVLPSVRRRFPHLRLRILEERTPRLVTLLGAGRLDLLLLALDTELGSVATLPLFDDDFLLATPVGHPLAGRKRLRESDLEGEEVLLLEDGHCLRDQALAVCHRAGAGEIGDFRASSLPTLLQMVGFGEGVTLVPAIAQQVEGRGNRSLAFVPFANPRPHRRIGIAWRRGSPREAEFRLLGEVLTEKN